MYGCVLIVEDEVGCVAGDAEVGKEFGGRFDAFGGKNGVEVERKHGKCFRLGAKVVKTGDTIVIIHNAVEITTNEG